MTATLETARDEIQAAFKAVWDADTPAVNGGSIPPVSWEGQPFTAPQSAAWARIRIRHTTGAQSTLTGGLGSAQGVRFEKTGIILVSVFTPIESGGGLVRPEQLASIAKKAFEGKATASQVWFRDVTVQEFGVDGPWFQMNVSASFSYDEFVV